MNDSRSRTVARTTMIAAIVLCTVLTALAFAALVAEVRAPRASALPLVMTSISDDPAHRSTPAGVFVVDPWARERYAPPDTSPAGEDALEVAEGDTEGTAALAVVADHFPVPVQRRPDPGVRDPGATPPPTTPASSYGGGETAVTPTTLSRESLADRTPPVTSVTLPLAVTSTTLVQIIVTPTTDTLREDEGDDDPDDRADRECVRPPLRDDREE